MSDSKHWFLTLYGMFSVGKTVLLGTTPGRVLIIRPPTDHTQSIPNPHAGLEEWVSHDWDEMNEIGEYLRMEGGKNHDVVCLDSISLWQDVGLDDIWAATKERNPARNSKHAGKDKGEFGRNMDRLSEWLRAVVSLDAFNFIVTAHPTDKLNDPLGERRLMPWVQGKGMSAGLCGMMTMVAYYEVRDPGPNTYRLLHTESTDEAYCKNQYAIPGAPWAPMRNPTMPQLIAKIDEARAKRSGVRSAGRRPAAATKTTTARRRPRKGAPA